MELRAIEMDRETGDWKWEEKSWKETWRKKKIEGESNEKKNKIVFLRREYLASYELYLKLYFLFTSMFLIGLVSVISCFR